MANRIMLNETSYHGAGAIKEIATEAKARAFKKAFVCSDPDLIKFNVTSKVTDILDKEGLAYEIYSDIKANPTIENVQHGVACAMMLPIVMEYNQDCTGEKYREIARAMGVANVDAMSVEEYRKAAIDAVRKLSADVGIPSKLEAIKESDLDFLAESAHADACAPGNPKDASVEDLKDLFRKIM